MTLTLYTNTEDPRKIAKTVSGGVTYTFTFKGESNIVKPQILISSATNISSYNYAYITEFDRYYYVTDITIMPNNVWQLDLNEDVLMSHSAEILATTGFVERSASDYNEMLVDDMAVIDNTESTETIAFSGSFLDQPEYILLLLGDRTLS